MRKIILLVCFLLAACKEPSPRTYNVVLQDGTPKTITCTNYSTYSREYAIQLICDGNTYYVISIEKAE